MTRLMRAASDSSGRRTGGLTEDMISILLRQIQRVIRVVFLDWNRECGYGVVVRCQGHILYDSRQQMRSFSHHAFILALCVAEMHVQLTECRHVVQVHSDLTRFHVQQLAYGRLASRLDVS